MSIGDKRATRRNVIYDQKTGRETWKITSWDDCNCIAAYMYNQAFSADEKYVVFSSDLTGKFELYRLELESGETIQLTASPVHILAYTICQEEVLFNDGNCYFGIGIKSLKRRIITGKAANNWIKIFGGPAVSSDGKRMACFYQDQDGRFGIAQADFAGSKLDGVYRLPEEVKQACHMQAIPTDGFMVTYVPLPDFQNQPDQPRDKRARAWKVDINTGHAEPFLIVPPGFRATHECWGHNKSNPRLYFHKKTVPSFTPASISSVDIKGLDVQQHFLSENRRLGHSAISYDNNWIVSDVQQPGENELYLININTGKAEILTWPNSRLSTLESGAPVGHVHPSFSPSSHYIIYTSDCSGKANVYIFPLP